MKMMIRDGRQVLVAGNRRFEMFSGNRMSETFLIYKNN